MVFELGLNQLTTGLTTLIVAISIWEVIWKGIGMWKCGRHNQLAWFVCILIFNTAGILPIVYLLFLKLRFGVILSLFD